MQCGVIAFENAATLITISGNVAVVMKNSDKELYCCQSHQVNVPKDADAASEAESNLVIQKMKAANKGDSGDSGDHLRLLLPVLTKGRITENESRVKRRKLQDSFSEYYNPAVNYEVARNLRGLAESVDKQINFNDAGVKFISRLLQSDRQTFKNAATEKDKSMKNHADENKRLEKELKTKDTKIAKLENEALDKDVKISDLTDQINAKKEEMKKLSKSKADYKRYNQKEATVKTDDADTSGTDKVSREVLQERTKQQKDMMDMLKHHHAEHLNTANQSMGIVASMGAGLINRIDTKHEALPLAITANPNFSVNMTTLLAPKAKGNKCGSCGVTFGDDVIFCPNHGKIN